MLTTFYQAKLRMLLLSCVLLSSHFVFSQTNKDVTIRGQISSQSTGETLPGVNVIIKGTSQGVISDIDGNYELECGIGSTVVFSCISFETTSFVISESKELNVALKSDVANLDELVIVGYGVQKKSHVTGSVAKVSTEGLDQTPVARADEALMGKISGVTIQQTDASAGAAPVIRVRGQSSVSASADPLVVIDGVVVDMAFFSSLNMADVASFEVLKDAASAAIYGSRAANGVIMVTTKKGGDSGGITKLSFNTYYGTKWAQQIDDLYPSIDEWVAKAEGSTNYDPVESPQIGMMKAYGNQENWQDDIFEGGNIQNYQVSASGGNAKSNFHISAGYLGDEGVVITDNFEKFTARVNVNSEINERLGVGMIINPSYTKQRELTIGMHDAMRNQPWLPVYHDEASLKYIESIGESTEGLSIGDYAHEKHFGALKFTSNNNSYSKIAERRSEYTTMATMANFYATIKLYDGLSFKTSIAGDYIGREYSFYQASTSNRNDDTEAQYDTYKKIHWANENIFSYNKQLGNHGLSAVAGFTFEKNHYTQSDMTASSFLNDYVETLNAGIISEGTTEEAVHTLVSYLFRANYDYQNKYLLTFSTRWDGSSKFGDNNKYACFPAASVGWRLDKESFLSDNETISMLKVRGSVGVTGNQSGIDEYAHISLVDPTYAILNGSTYSGYGASSLGDPNLQWERILEYGAAIELGLFSNRVVLLAEVYDKTSDQLLLDLEIPSIIGFTNTTTNIGKVQNKGIEFSLSTHNISTDDFSWKTNFNIAANKNEVLNVGGFDYISNVVDASKRPTEFRAYVGDNISAFYGYVTESEIDFDDINKDAFSGVGINTADVYVKDLDGDGEITSDDRQVIGSPFPDFTWGMTNTFNYKDFDFSFTLQGSHGAEVFNIDPYYFESQWKGDVYDGDVDMDKVRRKYETDYLVQDASFVALRNINLGYTLPRELTDRIGVGHTRIYASASNLLYMTADGYTSFNPEGINLYTDNPTTYGYQRGAMPIAKSFVMGLNLNF